MDSVQQLFGLLKDLRGIELHDKDCQLEDHTGNLLSQLQEVSATLSTRNHQQEADAILHVSSLCTQSQSFGGLGMSPDPNSEPSSKLVSEILFQVSAWLESLNSSDRYSTQTQTPLPSRPVGRRGMTVTEKIFAAHDIEGRGSVKPGDVVVVDVDWIMASEVSWKGMKGTYDDLGEPGIFRNDRFWLAGDHVVDPRVNHIPAIKSLIDASEGARKIFKMTEYQGMNYTIMHTEFYRERAQPGMLIIGSDSHTCSSGAVGCLSIGLGASDVTMPLVTGQTWFKVPDTVQISLVGAPPIGVGGKDVILYILKLLKHNTVASERIVEFKGPGAKHLSCDARFAICNMCMEFGAITGVFVPDETTFNFIEKRPLAKYKKSSHYYFPDDDAVYVETYQIDLSKVESFIAVYPSPDAVVAVSEISGTPLNGCFIGACTTTEEDLIVGGLVLEICLKEGLKPCSYGKRKVVPGSLPILHRLHTLGLIEIYEAAGFEIGIPGCSYCVGMSADKAAEGEIWLSSQNRNFQNRMGKGSIGHLASAATVASSSFNMRITDPQRILEMLNVDRLHELLVPSKGPSLNQKKVARKSKLTCVHPNNKVEAVKSSEFTTASKHSLNLGVPSPFNPQSQRYSGKVNRLGDYIDTDALAPAQYLISCTTNEEIGSHCLEFTQPEFRDRVKEGCNIVVAGEAFGCGSSREQAVSALLGCGVQCVIAKSYSYMYARNQPSLGLLGIIITDPEFYKLASNGVEIVVDVSACVVEVQGKNFLFVLSKMEREFITAGGIGAAFRMFGKDLFCAMTKGKDNTLKHEEREVDCGTLEEVQW